MASEKTFFSIAAAGLAFGAAVILLKREPRVRLPLNALINPAYANALAEKIPNGLSEDDYVFHAWNLVNQYVSYEDYGSNMFFKDSYIECAQCILPEDVLTAGKGNCIGKAALLASLLRHRIAADRVFVVIGYVNHGGELGGHAWLMLRRQDGELYVLESTAPPHDWLKASEAEDRYIPHVILNENMRLCEAESGQFCTVG